MKRYTYQAIDSSGRTVTGTIDAESPNKAFDLLIEQGLQIQSLSVAGMASETVQDPQNFSTNKNLIGARDSLFMKSLDQLLADTNSLLPALRAAEQERISPKSSKQLRKLAEQISDGISAEQFIGKPEYVACLPILVNGISDADGDNRWSVLFEDNPYVRSPWQSTFRVYLYPAFLIILTLAVFLLVTSVAIGPFIGLFRDFGLRVPTPTQIVFWIQRVTVERTLLVALVCIGIGVVSSVAVYLTRRYSVATRVFGFAIAGNTNSISAMARFVQILSSVLQLRATYAEAFRLAGQGCGNYYYKIAGERMATYLDAGHVNLSTAPVAHTFPSTVLHGLQAGPSQSPSFPLLRDISRMYALRVTHRAPLVAEFATPLLIAIVGAAIAFVFLAVLMPIMGLMTALS